MKFYSFLLFVIILCSCINKDSDDDSKLFESMTMEQAVSRHHTYEGRTAISNLIDNGFNLNTNISTGQTEHHLLYILCEYNHPDLAKKVIEKGYKVTDDLATYEKILDRICSGSGVSYYGGKRECYYDIVKLLIENGVPVYEKHLEDAKRRNQYNPEIYSKVVTYLEEKLK